MSTTSMQALCSVWDAYQAHHVNTYDILRLLTETRMDLLDTNALPVLPAEVPTGPQPGEPVSSTP
ncbi:MAG TPA: hypothetical protein VMU34_13720 [Mycobacterium sp.]|nr:hypothetical protein [Mycobacterium sp.]